MYLHSVPIILSIDEQIRDIIFSIIALLYIYLYLMFYMYYICVYIVVHVANIAGEGFAENFKLDLEEEEQSNSDKTERASE